MVPCPVFVINLERDVERRSHMQRLLNNLDIDAEFIPAVDGTKLTDADKAMYNETQALKIYGSPMLPTEIGCYLSHYRLLQRIVRDNIPFALILEDDLDISPSLPATVTELLHQPDPSWLVVRLESLRSRVVNPQTNRECGKPVMTLTAGVLYKLGVHVLGFGAYLISREGAKRMLDYGQRIFMPIDQTMDRFWDNGIVPYVVRPFPIRQRTDFESRIGSRPKGRHLSQPLKFRLWRRWQRLVDGINKRIYARVNALY